MNRQPPMMKAARKMALGILLGAAWVPSVLAQDVTVNGGNVYQKIEGMGLLLDTNSNTPPSGRMMSQLYSSQSNGGLGLHVLRVEDCGDPTLHDCTPNVYKSWLPRAYAQSNRATVWLGVWTFPTQWTVNNTETYPVASQYYQAAANWLVGEIQWAQGQGVPIYAVDVTAESLDACPLCWSAQQFHDFIGYLGPAMKAANLQTTILMPEEYEWDFSLAATTMNDPATAQYVGVLAAHDYGTGKSHHYPPPWSTGHLWETETEDPGQYNAPFDPGMASGLDMAVEMHDLFSGAAHVNEYQYFAMVDCIEGTQEWNCGLYQSNGKTTKRYYVMGNFSDFVRPGWVNIGATGEPVGGVLVSAYKDPSSGNFVIVAVNPNASSSSLNIILNSLSANSVTPWETSASLNLLQEGAITVSGGQFSVTLDPKSVTTYVSNGSSSDPQVSFSPSSLNFGSQPVGTSSPRKP